VASLWAGFVSSLVVIAEFQLMYCKRWIEVMFDVLFDWLKCFHHFASCCMIQQFHILPS
jgi:hypothetical protein